MTFELCLISLVLATQSCDPKDLDPDQTTALFEEGEAQRAGHIKSMTRTLENTKRKLALAKTGKYYADAGGGFSFEEEFRNKAEKDKAIAAYQERLDSINKRLAGLRDESVPIVPDILNSVRVGSIGRLPFVAKVQQKNQRHRGDTRGRYRRPNRSSKRWERNGDPTRLLQRLRFRLCS